MSDPSRVESIFFAALGKDTAERADYLDQACGADAALRFQVERKLYAHPQADDFLARSVVVQGVLDSPDEAEDAKSPAPTSGPEAVPRVPMTGTDVIDAGSPRLRRRTPPAGTDLCAEDSLAGRPLSTTAGGSKVDRRAGFVPGRVVAGRYTLLEVLGQGGMGTVYRAEQSRPVRRQVALKLIRTGTASHALLARFEAERQALALMDHPGIARVFDGGATEADEPFFVMELVDGAPITEYCDQHRLSVRARLELFVAVCQAVQHAHQKGVIHRDLKPSNVLVTEIDGRPAPKVIDFGVAKAMEFNLAGQSLAETGLLVGTPTYMSPEQADLTSVDIDTRADVYALGVLLYELLAGSPPLEAKQYQRGAALEMLRMVREVDPLRPSTKVGASDSLPDIAARRDVEPEHLRRALRGDLDWIVMKGWRRTARADTRRRAASPRTSDGIC